MSWAASVATLTIVLWSGLGALTGSVARNRGQNGVVWLVVGLALPVVALIALVVFFVHDPGDDGEHSVPRPDEAARTDPVARALAEVPGATPEQLARRTQMSASAVKGDLRALRTLGMVEHDGRGRWQLTEVGAESIDS